MLYSITREMVLRVVLRDDDAQGVRSNLMFHCVQAAPTKEF